MICIAGVVAPSTLRVKWISSPSIVPCQRILFVAPFAVRTT